MLNQRERAAQKIIHDLFNDLEKSKDSSFKDIQDVLMKVYQKLDDPKIEQAPLVNRLLLLQKSSSFPLCKMNG